MMENQRAKGDPIESKSFLINFDENEFAPNYIIIIANAENFPFYMSHMKRERVHLYILRRVDYKSAFSCSIWYTVLERTSARASNAVHPHFKQ